MKSLEQRRQVVGSKWNPERTLHSLPERDQREGAGKLAQVISEQEPESRISQSSSSACEKPDLRNQKDSGISLSSRSYAFAKQSTYTRLASPHIPLNYLVLMLSALFPVPSPLFRPHEPFRLRNGASDGSLGESLKAEANRDIDDCNHEQLDFKPEGKVNDIEDEGDWSCRYEENVGAKSPKASKTDNQ